MGATRNWRRFATVDQELSEPVGSGTIEDQSIVTVFRAKSRDRQEVQRWKAAHSENGSSSKAAASITVSINSDMQGRSW
jgi:hypothetical protein